MTASKTEPEGLNHLKTRNPNWGTPESIRDALRETKGKVFPAAKLLGVSRASLRHRIAELKASENGNGSGPADPQAEHAGEVFHSPLYDLAILSRDKWADKRPCWYCGLLFAPVRPNNWDQHFCCDDHRTSFNKWGYLPFDKLMLAVQTEIRRQVNKLVLESFIEATVSKSHAILCGMQRHSETIQRDYIRKTVAAMLSNPERMRKTLAAMESGGETPE